MTYRIVSSFTFKSLMSSFAIAVIYILVTIYLMNGTLVRNSVLGNFPLEYKGKLLFALAGGMWTAMTKQGLTILVVTALLTGLNLSLLFNRVHQLQRQENMRLVIGGGSLLGVIGSGCASCGLPVLALLGLGGSVAYLPLNGMELSYFSVLLLLVSFYFLTKTSTSQSCTLNSSR